uniref:Uncharacterized protein n=1 Tax=Tanacetum cinerariifolium TaxID=118510 RepID=A0A6L2P1B0_TANCI|nr:hypothetical protein [Tanacetum cinerariifolium]
MALFDYRLNPLYSIKECSSCGALYTTDYCCSEESVMDKIICDVNKTPDLSQRPSQNFPKYGYPIDGYYCQGCALLRKKFKEDMFKYCIEMEFSKILPSHPMTIQTLLMKGAHYGYNCLPKVPIMPNPEPFNNQTIDELPQIMPSFNPTCYPKYGNSFTYDSKSNLVHDSLIISSSSKIGSLFDEFAGEITLLKSILSGIKETDCDPEEEIRLFKILFDSLMEEFDLSFTPDDPMPPGLKEDDYDFERDILLLEELLSNDSLSLPGNISFHFDIPSTSHPTAKPQDGNSGILNVKVMGDITEHKVPMPRLMFTQPTLVLNQEKSPNLLSHQGHEASQPSTECPMMIYGRNVPILDVSFIHFYLP